MENNGIINSLEDAIKIIRDLVQEVNENNTSDSFTNFISKGSFMHGFWFRGEKYDTEDPDFIPLNPSIFRKQNDGSYLSETTIFNYLPTINDKLRSFTDPFDRLSHLQHYSIPTRLLDWSDSILTALYFAISADLEKPVSSRLYILNASALNEVTCFKKLPTNIHNTVDYGVRLRNVFLISEHESEFKTIQENDGGLNGVNALSKFVWDHKDMNRKFHQIFDFDKRKDSYSQSEKCLILSTPIAVYPNRINPRLISQNGLFTYHGGKLGKVNGSNIPLPKPYNLLEINSQKIIEKTGQRIMRAYEIPANAKPRLRSDLMNLKIHEGSLFPELDKQRDFVKLISKLP